MNKKIVEKYSKTKKKRDSEGDHTDIYYPLYYLGNNIYIYVLYLNTYAVAVTKLALDSHIYPFGTVIFVVPHNGYTDLVKVDGFTFVQTFFPITDPDRRVNHIETVLKRVFYE